MLTQILAPLTVAAVTISGVVFAQTPQAGQDHSSHHPASNDVNVAAPAPGSLPSAEAFNQQMKAMQDMHQRMKSAKTPAERAKVMDDHMRVMQSSMAMMSQMHGGTMGMSSMSAMSGSTSGGMGTMPPGAQGSSSQSQSGSHSGMSGMSGMCGMMNMHVQMERRMTMMEHLLHMMVDRFATVPSN